MTFAETSTASVIQDSGKVHGHDNISKKINVKICGSAIFKMLAIIIKRCIDTVLIQSEWEKGNSVPINKKATSKH